MTETLFDTAEVSQAIKRQVDDQRETEAKFHKKLNKIFAKIMTLDWEPDKGYQVKGTMVKYISLPKIKRNIAPVLAAEKMNFGVTICEPKIIGEHLCVKAKVTLTDVDTGYGESSSALGCTSISGDKAMQIATSFALKSWLSTNFLLIDGIDPDEQETPKGTVFVKKTREENEEIKSKIQSNAVPIPEKPEPVQETQEQDGVYTLTGIENRTINNIVEKWKDKVAKKTATNEQFEEMIQAVREIDSKEKVRAFITKYKVI